MNVSKYTIGIISPAFDSFLWSNILENFETLVIDRYTYHAGFTGGLRIVILGCAMEAATVSLATFLLPQLDHLTHLVYLGYAGAVNEKVKIGDFVVATQMMTQATRSNLQESHNDQNDTSVEIFVNTEISSLLQRAAQQVILETEIDPLISAAQEAQFRINATPTIFLGHVGVGDPFFISQAKRENVLKHNTEIICLEKEGTAIATISKQYHLPLGLMHIIVHAEDDSEQIDYAAFITTVANRYLAEITLNFIHILSELASIN